MNPGNEQNTPVGTGPAALFPDIVLCSPDRGRRLQAVVEVETGESVNHLEALAQWAHYARIRAAFHLYVPASMVDVARRLCEDNLIHVGEVWSYHVVGDEPRFTLVLRNRDAAPAPRVAKPATKPAVKAAEKPAAPPAAAPRRSAAPKKTALAGKKRAAPIRKKGSTRAGKPAKKATAKGNKRR
jgi:hypothetical protein